MTDGMNSHSDLESGSEESDLSVQKWGGIAAFLLAAAFFIAPSIYLVGNLRDAFGRFGYSLADFLYGPIWGASLLTMVYALRERLGESAPCRMSLALLAAGLAAAAMVAVACIRASNRHYHLIHPELHLENSQTVLIIWTTLVTGVTAAGWHLLGWALLLIGSAGLASSGLPRPLSVLYLLGGLVSLFVYLVPDIEGLAAFLGMLIGIWQGVLLLRSGRENKQTPQIQSSRLDRA